MPVGIAVQVFFLMGLAIWFKTSTKPHAKLIQLFIWLCHTGVTGIGPATLSIVGSLMTIPRALVHSTAAHRTVQWPRFADV